MQVRTKEQEEVIDLLQEAIAQWVKNNWRLPIPDPVEYFSVYDANGKDAIQKATVDMSEREEYDFYANLDKVAFDMQCRVVNFPIPTKDVCNLCDCNNSTLTKWARTNNVSRIMFDTGKTGFIWTEDDCRKFFYRNKE